MSEGKLYDKILHITPDILRPEAQSILDEAKKEFPLDRPMQTPVISIIEVREWFQKWFGDEK